jgi:peroxiredoxin
MQNSTYIGALKMLIAQGQLTMQDVAEISRKRVLSALLPMAFRDGGAIHTPLSGTIPPRPLGSIDAVEAVQAAESYASQLNLEARALHPADSFLAAAPVTPSVTQTAAREQALVSQLAAQGLNLGEIAQRLPMRWDRLAQHVAALLTQGTLRRSRGDETTAVSPRLSAGDLAPDFRLPTLSGQSLRLSDLRGQRVWLVFNRQSTCALCNPHNAQIITMHEHMRQQGVQIVTVWGSSVEDLSQGIGTLRPPYPVLADPQDRTYNQYGLEMSLRGTLDARNLSTALQGIKMMGSKALKSDGELLRMPAEFLIGPDGIIEEAHYNSYGSDWLPMERVIEWAAAGTQAK